MTRATVKLAVLFADISGSTRLYEQMGDTGAFGQIKDCLQILTLVTEQHKGWVVKTIGDGIMCAFPDVDSAALAACSMQRHIAQRPAARGREKISIRVGFHCGTVLRDGKEIFGDAVNLAAGIAALATASHIAITSAAAALLSPQLNLRVRKLTAMPVKGKRTPIDVHEIAWQDAGQETHVPGRISSHAQLVQSRLNIEFRQRKYVFRDSFTIGRDETSDLVIDDPMASRHHARVEKRKEQFVLIDQSTNGSYVTVTGRREIPLHRAEFMLYGSGQIAFGDSTDVRPDVAIVRFFCESAGAPA